MAFTKMQLHSNANLVILHVKLVMRMANLTVCLVIVKQPDLLVIMDHVFVNLVIMSSIKYASVFIFIIKSLLLHMLDLHQLVSRWLYLMSYQ